MGSRRPKPPKGSLFEFALQLYSSASDLSLASLPPNAPDVLPAVPETIGWLCIKHALEDTTSDNARESLFLTGTSLLYLVKGRIDSAPLRELWHHRVLKDRPILRWHLLHLLHNFPKHALWALIEMSSDDFASGEARTFAYWLRSALEGENPHLSCQEVDELAARVLVGDIALMRATKQLRNECLTLAEARLKPKGN